jgi:hypothetical protein
MNTSLTSKPIGPLSPRVKQFLSNRTLPKKARIVFAIDATESRERTWDMASQQQGEMFATAASLGGVDIQLVYYRGCSECVASRWIPNAHALAAIMSGVRCRAGKTKIERVLAHARQQNQEHKVDALIIVSDACEETPADLYAEATELEFPVFLFQEGADPAASQVYAQIARITGGAHVRFDAGSAQRLAELLRAITAFAVGGLKALAAQRTQAAQLLLAQIKH